MSGEAASGKAAPGEGWRPAANPWTIALVVTLAAFMEVLDTTIVNVALPYIAGTMAVSNDESTWTLTSYLVANAIVLTISGWLGNIFGRKRYFLICIGMFTVFSFLCGISSNITQLILFRLMQGFFGGGLQPNQQSIILDTFPPAKRGAAFAVTAVATIVAPVLGPTVGGWITVNYSWRWIFFINVPVGLFTFLAVQRLVEDPPWVKKAEAEARRRGHIDYIGLSLITLGLGALQVMMDRGEDEDWFGSGFIRILFVGAVVGIGGAIWWLWTARHPIVNIRIFRDRNFAVGCLMIAAMAAVLYASAVVIPQFAQEELGYNAYNAGLILSPGALLVVFLIPFVGRVMPHLQTRLVIGFGFFCLGCSLAYSHNITPDVDFWTLAGMRAAQTFGLAFLFVPISTIVYSTLPKEANADAAALFTMLRNVAGSVSISAATAIVRQRTQIRLAHLQPNLSQQNPAFELYLQHVRHSLHTLGFAPGKIAQQALDYAYQTWQTQSSILAYTDLFAITSILSFAVIPFVFLFSPSKSGGGAAMH